MPCLQSDTRSVLWGVPPSTENSWRSTKHPEKLFFLQFYPVDCHLGSRKGSWFFRRSWILEAFQTSWRNAALGIVSTYQAWSGGLFTVGLRLFDLWGDYLLFYKHWCFLLGEWHGSWQAPARRGSAESLTEAVPPYRARKKPHRPLPLLISSSWSRCATASHSKEFLKSKQNKFLYQSSASSASWTPNTSAQCQKSSPNLSIHLLEQYNNL